MTRIHSYLSFNGNCREAMRFYRSCLGGNLALQTVGDSPHPASLPAPMKKAVVQGTLTRDNWVLMGSDLMAEGLVRGNNMALMLCCSSEKQARSYYKKLSSGGRATHPLHNTYWGALFGNLTDRYGNHWLLHYDKATAKKK